MIDAHSHHLLGFLHSRDFQMRRLGHLLVLHNLLLDRDISISECDNLVTESSRNLLECLLSGLPVRDRLLVDLPLHRHYDFGDNSREVKVGHDEEKGGAADKDVVVVLLDGGKGAGPGFGDYTRWVSHGFFVLARTNRERC